MKFNTRLKLLTAAVAVIGTTGLAFGQEVAGGATTQSKPMSSQLGAVSQARLNKAESDKQNWLQVTAGTRRRAITRARRSTRATSQN
jgi:hypothetical protein